MTGADTTGSDTTGSDTRGTGTADTGGGPALGIGPDPVVLRPRVLLISAWVSAAIVVAIFAVVAYLLPEVDTGVYFRAADQVSMLVLGLLIAGGLLLMARPRVRADAGGIEIRNVWATHWYPWAEVEGIAFPDGASWARIDLPDDEYLPVLAVQAVDRQLAVRGIRTLRGLHGDSRRPARG
ncbi:PH (Pleckstrin Homology) domain-containing protein [Pseudonocardia sediminis]|uniref:PH (Pleckstrin Homology) domain-containing protein n=1 Tax=Pseudonocardia sediminis TaxID=1397368 RepID=A0A4Q7V0V3_PSEST|nr:PH domain-containing protein [Pseudonocardia sediminis]RZT86213.1 PH (Pleckstrin Homology) domain-containing protein [Pseudonocardia sediminis]